MSFDIHETGLLEYCLYSPGQRFDIYLKSIDIPSLLYDYLRNTTCTILTFINSKTLPWKIHSIVECILKRQLSNGLYVL